MGGVCAAVGVASRWLDVVVAMSEGTGSCEGEGFCSRWCSKGWLGGGRDASKASSSKLAVVEALKLAATYAVYTVPAPESC